jgi:hypothetical protein
VADPGAITAPASSALAQIIADLIDEAHTAAVAYFETQPAGAASVTVTLTTDTAVGTVPLGMWTFVRDEDGTIHPPSLEAPGG